MLKLCPPIQITLVLACLVSTGSGYVKADIYSWKDENGNTVYSDQKTSDKAQPSVQTKQTVNYYSAPQKPAPAADNAGGDSLATLEAVDEGDDTKAKPLTEKQCQQMYQRSCDQVQNWQKYARKACGNDARCDDPNYLDRKYRPRTTEELREVARKAAVRNNNNDDKIEEFLRKKYSNYCENQAAMFCRQQRNNASCMAQMQSQCEDPRGLDQFLAKYHNLSPQEKKQIIEQAKAMATANGDDSLDYDQMIASLVDILITQALMGI